MFINVHSTCIMASKRGLDSDSSNTIIYEDSQFPMLDSDDNLIDELDQYFLETDIDILDELDQQFIETGDDIIGETSQAFMEASPFFRKLPLYYQIGSGLVSHPGDTHARPVYTTAENVATETLKEAIILEEHSRRRNQKYNAEEIIYRARVDIEKLPERVHRELMTVIMDLVREIFFSLLVRIRDNFLPRDLIRICIQAEGLDKPISTTLMPISEMTVEKLLTSVVKVLQSKDEIKLDSGFMLDSLIIKRPLGAGRRKICNIEFDRVNKRCILQTPGEDDELCCAKSIVYALAHLEKNRRDLESFRKRNRLALLNAAVALHNAAGVPIGPCTYREISMFEKHLDVQVAVLTSENSNRVSYKGENRPRRINLWLHENHYDVVTSLKAFYGSKFYCELCDKPYQRREDHTCTEACDVCKRRECVRNDEQKCEDCNRFCRSKECFQIHKAITGNQQYSLCDRVYQCRQCRKKIASRDCPQEMHRCGTTKCPSCQTFVIAEEHRCLLKRIASKNSSDQLIFFDFETDQSTRQHRVNYAVAHYADGSEEIFRGYTACHDFCTWLFQPKHKGFTVIAHNMKGFDGQFIMAWILDQGIIPEVIPNGSMVMAICHKPLSIRIIDSLNFFPMALSKLPACFGLEELKKGFFPHLFNSTENQSYVGPFPETKYYSPDTMTPTTRQEFLSWHDNRQGEVFDFQKEILAYCRSDVDILRRCCLAFRTEFLQATNVDPFQYVTIASACMAVYRSGHIKENSLAMVPVHGYINGTNFSADCIRWLDFSSFTQKIKIQHALNSTGEYKIGGISVDGFCSDTKTIYQYHGCFFHGCMTCFNGDDLHPLKNVSMSTLYQKTKETTSKLQALGFSVIEMWEHNFLEKKRKDPALQAFLTTHNLQDRLNPRDAFFGGRTNAIKLYHEGDAKYIDFTSLYPWVNKYCMYPVGHPEIITEGLNDINDYFGIVKCRVAPSRGLYLPVLPYRSQKKLMFPLCRTCVDTMQQTTCNHTEDERALIGTWVSEEVKLAIKKGYKVTHIYEVYNFKDTSDTLFKSYIDLFLKIKQESSGWPSNCETVEQRNDYIKEYYEREAVLLDPACIAKNSGRRQVEKLALNSFWGRWGMNINKRQLTFVNNVSDFNKILNDSTKNIKNVYLPNEEVACIQWENEKYFVKQETSTNIFIACFTTAWARLKLYSEMEKIGKNVLYHDTDSIIYAQNGLNDPPLGNFLGEFTDEIDGDVINKFVSGGPKNYAYVTAAGKTACKIRGFTLNFRNSLLLNFETVKSMVCGGEEKAILIRNPNKICRDVKRRKVYNREEIKLYRVIYDKRVIQPDLTTLPYGF